MRLLPIGDNTHEKVFNKIKEGDADGAFDAYFNNMMWYHFLEKCGLSIWTKYIPHKVGLFTYTPNSWLIHATIYVNYDWLNDEFSEYTIPDYPKPENEDEYPKALKIPIWKRYGQRHIEDFEE